MERFRSGLVWEEAQVWGGTMPHTLCSDHLLSAERPWTQLNKSETHPVMFFFPAFWKEILYLHKDIIWSAKQTLRKCVSLNTRNTLFQHHTPVVQSSLLGVGMGYLDFVSTVNCISKQLFPELRELRNKNGWKTYAVDAYFFHMLPLLPPP